MLRLQSIRANYSRNTAENCSEHASAHLVSQESATGAADERSSQSSVALLSAAWVGLPTRRAVLARLLVPLRRIAAALWVSLLLLGIWAVAAVVIALMLRWVLALGRVALGWAAMLVVALLLLAVLILVLLIAALLIMLRRTAVALLGRAAVALLWRIAALSLRRTTVVLLLVVAAAAAASVVVVA